MYQLYLRAPAGEKATGEINTRGGNECSRIGRKEKMTRVTEDRERMEGRERKRDRIQDRGERETTRSLRASVPLPPCAVTNCLVFPVHTTRVARSTHGPPVPCKHARTEVVIVLHSKSSQGPHNQFWLFSLSVSLDLCFVSYCLSLAPLALSLHLSLFHSLSYSIFAPFPLSLALLLYLSVFLPFTLPRCFSLSI